MKQFAAHVNELEQLLGLAQTSQLWPAALNARIAAALDGQTAASLRRLVPLADRREAGAFFTSSQLSSVLLEGFGASLPSRPFVVDPACGAGNLLVAAVPHLIAVTRPPDSRPHSVSKMLNGIDINERFVAAARLRLRLALMAAGERDPKDLRTVTHASGLDVHPSYAQATNILLNPPFSSIPAPEQCSWATGAINAAALFFLHALEHASEGTEVRAILPDVLRSGSRYRAWRALIDQKAHVTRLETYGRFDTWTDVDVFVLQATVGDGPARKARWTPTKRGTTVGDLFDISVGPVVNFRDPYEGTKKTYLVARDLPVWTTVRALNLSRKWTGVLTTPPFVAIRRTSSSGEQQRARATIINTARPVAVDNHLIVCKPKDGRLETCQELLDLLRSPQTSRWLDRRIRCRHLTVGAVADIPRSGVRS